MRVPADPMRVLSAPSPIAGDPDAVEDARRAAERAAAACPEYRAGLARARDALRGAESATVARLRGRLDTGLPAGARALERSAEAAADGLRVYAAEVDRIHAESRRVRRRVGDELARIHALATRVEEIALNIGAPSPTEWRAPPPVAMPSPRPDARAAAMSEPERATVMRGLEQLHRHEWESSVRKWHEACGRVDAEGARWEALVDERRASERTLLAALGSTVIGRAIAVGESQGGPGAAYAIARSFAGELHGQPTTFAGDPVARIVEGGCSPAEVARLWESAVRGGADITALIEAYPFELARTNGLPFEVIDRAARAALARALDDEPGRLAEAYYRLGYDDGPPSSLEGLRSDLLAVREALRRADAAVGSDDAARIVGLGQHDGAVTASIAMGDIDAATTIGVFVPGMSSNVHGLDDPFGAFEIIRDGDANVAMVSWLGYRSPGLVGETMQARADAGAVELAGFLEGVAAQRGDALDRFVLLGHSYGTNVAAEALRAVAPGTEVDAYVAIGSAGLRVGTTAADLGVAEIHATNARGDGIAEPIGQRLHFRHRSDGGGLYEKRVDPRDLEGAREFSSERTADGEAVTMHNLVDPIAWPGPLQLVADIVDGTAAADEVGYLSRDSSTVAELGNIMRRESR